MSGVLGDKLIQRLFIFARAYPLIINIALVISFLITNNYENLYILGFLIVNNCINYGLKNVCFKPIMKNNKFPIIGLGKRPYGAKNCGIFNIKNKNEGYGMPSGHSQDAAIFSTYLFLKTKDGILDENIKLVIQSILVLLTLFIMYSRIYLNCHTIQQVLVGASIGIFLGQYFYNIKDIFIY